MSLLPAVHGLNDVVIVRATTPSPQILTQAQAALDIPPPSPRPSAPQPGHSHLQHPQPRPNTQVQPQPPHAQPSSEAAGCTKRPPAPDCDTEEGPRRHGLAGASIAGAPGSVPEPAVYNHNPKPVHGDWYATMQHVPTRGPLHQRSWLGLPGVKVNRQLERAQGSGFRECVGCGARVQQVYEPLHSRFIVVSNQFLTPHLPFLRAATPGMPCRCVVHHVAPCRTIHIGLYIGSMSHHVAPCDM